MFDSPRRGFLKVAGVGAAAAGAAVVAAPSASASGATKAVPRSARGAVVAHIPDVHGSELVVMVEGREVHITDRDLVARLAHAIHSGTAAG